MDGIDTAPPRAIRRGDSSTSIASARRFHVSSKAQLDDLPLMT